MSRIIKKENKIGGEYEINPQELNDLEILKTPNKTSMFSNGRSALMFILKQISIQNTSIVYLPYYICPSVVSACKNSKFKVKFYELDEKFLFPINLLSKIEHNSSIILVNYFGFINNNKIIKTIKNKRPDIITINDSVQSFWTFNKSIADYSFTSLRKQFAIPDGALIYHNNKIIKPSSKIKENNFFTKKVQASVSKFKKEEDYIYLNLFEEGEKILDNEKSITKASIIAESIFNKTDFETITTKRKKNYKTIYELGQKHSLDFIFPYSEEIIPLCVPIKINNRNKIRKELFQNNIFLPIHWLSDYYNKKSKMSKEMADNEISLIIDQRYSEDAMIFQIKTLISLIN